MYHNDERRALDRWARDRGCRDFDTYLANGGSFIHARRDIERRRQDMDRALHALIRYSRAREPELDMVDIRQETQPTANGHDARG